MASGDEQLICAPRSVFPFELGHVREFSLTVLANVERRRARI